MFLKQSTLFSPFTARVFDGICKVALTFASYDEILSSDHSNESSLPVLTHGTICFSKFYKMKFGNLIKICIWVSLALCIISERSLITISRTTTLTSCREKKIEY